jgi:hypothetical protein
MSSIRRSSLISITLGPLTVIGATFVRFPEEAGGQRLECPVEPGRAQLNFLDSLRYRGFKVAHRTDNHFAVAFSPGGDGGRKPPEHPRGLTLRKFQRTELCRSKGSPGSDRGFKDSSYLSLRDRALKRCNIIQSENRHKPPSKKHRSSSKKNANGHSVLNANCVRV